MSNNKSVFFNVYRYQGDAYSNTFDEIIQVNGTKFIDLNNSNIDTIYALPLDKIIVTLADTINTTTSAYDDVSNTSILWDFGDGTISTDLSAVHWYKFPGTYTIKLTVFDSNLSPIVSDYNTTISVYNYIPHELPINKDGNYDFTYGDVIKIEPLNLVDSTYLSTFDGEIEDISQIINENGNTQFYLDTPFVEFNIHKFNSWQSYSVASAYGYNIQLRLSDGDHAPFISQSEYMSNAYSHLSSTSRFVDDSDTIIDSLHFDCIGTEVYIRYDHTLSAFVTCSGGDDAYMIGTYDMQHIRFTNDTPIDYEKLTISTVFDTTGFKTSDSVYGSQLQQYFNHIPHTFTFTTVLTSVNDKVKINIPQLTTSGVSGMNTYEFKYVNEPIPFVYSIGFKYNNTFHPFKNINQLTLAFNGEIRYKNELVGEITMKSGNSTVSAIFEPIGEYPGCLRGVVYITSPANNVKFNVTKLTLSDTDIEINPYPNTADTDQWSNAVNNVFNVIDNKTHLQLFKINENFSLSDFYKSLRLQPILRESDNLFNDVFEAIVGDGSSYNNLGVRLYEKISNFVSNTKDIDTCNVAYLYDIYNQFNEYIADLNYNWPEELQRLIDLISIKFNKLKGTANTYNLDFDKRGYINNSNYGINLGKPIDFYNETIDYGEPIVAYEKFSEKYIKLNTYLDPNILDDSNCTYNGTTSSIKLSAYNYNYWGWPLVLPLEKKDCKGCLLSTPCINCNNFNIEDYYTFYRYIDKQDGDILNGILNLSNQHNTFNTINAQTSEAEWDQIKRIYLLQTIIQGLQLQFKEFSTISIITQPTNVIVDITQ